MCVLVRLGQHHCLQLASNCFHNGLCLLLCYVPYKVLLQKMLK